MLSGRPQLVVPHMGDQWDNGRRVERLGIAKVLPAAKYSADRAQTTLADLLNNETTARLAQNIANKIGTENGAVEAANFILSQLRYRSR